jgi:hypothetical protein
LDKSVKSNESVTNVTNVTNKPEGKIILTDKKKDVLEKGKKVGEKSYQLFEIHFPDKVKASGEVSDGIASITNIASGNGGRISNKNKTEIYERTLTTLAANAIKTLLVDGKPGKTVVNKLVEGGVLMPVAGNNKTFSISRDKNIITVLPTVQNIAANAPEQKQPILQIATERSGKKYTDPVFNIPAAQKINAPNIKYLYGANNVMNEKVLNTMNNSTSSSQVQRYTDERIVSGLSSVEKAIKKIPQQQITVENLISKKINGTGGTVNYINRSL